MRTDREWEGGEGKAKREGGRGREKERKKERGDCLLLL